MNRSPKRRACALFTAVVLVAVPALGEEPRSTMQQIFSAIAELLPASVRDDGFSDPARAPAQRAALMRLSDSAAALRTHAERRNIDFQARSDELADDAERALLAFDLGRGAEVSMALHRVTQDCVGCHSRLPDLQDAQVAERWLDRAGLAGLRAEERARLYVATRRFDDALQTWEGLFRDADITPFELATSDEVVAYLTVSVRVKRNLSRARRTLEALALRSDAPRFVSARMSRWARDLEALEAERATATDPLDLARELAARARARDGIPFMRDGLVYDLVAGSLWMAWLDHPPPAATARQRAEAWYRLAISDERVAAATALPRSEVYLEAALRADRHGEFAERAYEALEEFVLWDHGAPFVEALPAPARERMVELEALVFQDAEDATQ